MNIFIEIDDIAFARLRDRHNIIFTSRAFLDDIKNPQLRNINSECTFEFNVDFFKRSSHSHNQTFYPSRILLLQSHSNEVKLKKKISPYQNTAGDLINSKLK